MKRQLRFITTFLGAACLACLVAVGLARAIIGTGRPQSLAPVVAAYSGWLRDQIHNRTCPHDPRYCSCFGPMESHRAAEIEEHRRRTTQLDAQLNQSNEARLVQNRDILALRSELAAAETTAATLRSAGVRAAELEKACLAKDAEIAAVRARLSAADAPCAPGIGVGRDARPSPGPGGEAHRSPVAAGAGVRLVRIGEAVPLPGRMGEMRLVSIDADACRIRVTNASEDWCYRFGQIMDVFAGPASEGDLRAKVTALNVVARDAVAFRIEAP